MGNTMAERRAEDMENSLDTLVMKRKSGEISPKEFYIGLLELLRDVTDSLIAEVESGMSEEDVKEQIPLVLAILKEQIGGLEKRGR